MDPTVLWTTPAPLWPAVANPADVAARGAFRQPAILRFATDTFMDDFLALLDAAPARMGELRAQPETWRRPAPAPSAEPVRPLPKFARNFDRQGLIAARSAKSMTPTVASPARAVTDTTLPLKLFHPAHQRFYLVAASLVCQITGLPDRVVNTASEERVTFVMRRLRPSSDGKSLDEFAFTATPTGLAWQKVAGGAPLAQGEEQLPLFPVTFNAGGGRKRRLFAGMIPVGKREAYLAAPAVNAATPSAQTLPAPQVSPRESLLLSQVIEPWNNLIDVANRAMRRINTGMAAAITADDKTKAVTEAKNLAKSARNQIHMTSWYLLLDFARYLAEHLPEVWKALNNQAPANPLTTQEQTLVSALSNIQISPDFASALTTGSIYTTANVVTSLSNALVMSAAREDTEQNTDRSLERITDTYDRTISDPNTKWPSFIFPLADVEATTPNQYTVVPILRMPMAPGAAAPLLSDFNYDFPAWLAAITDTFKSNIADLKAKVVAALPAASSAPLPPVMLAAQLPIDAGDPGYFVIRFIFERPNCGPLQPAIISDPGPVFQMAAFFDPEAPARPIRISLPMDTTPAGLRKFDKNTAFMMSDILCKQMDGMCNLSLGDLVLSVLPWPFHKDLSISSGGMGGCTDGAGMICSFSIPIITICALIILMMIVKLLDIVFNWMAFFKVCFSLPGFLAKK